MKRGRKGDEKMKTLLMIIATILVISGWLTSFAVWPGDKYNKIHNDIPTILFVVGVAVDVVAMFVP